MSTIKIKVQKLEVEAELNDSATAKLIQEKLPITSEVNTWGDEIYFTIPVKTDLEDKFARDVVEMGDLGYWPKGSAFCIFFGPTPVSQGDEIRPASAVNVIGRVLTDPRVFKKVASGEKIELVKA